MLSSRLDNIAATILPLVYLAANIGATGYYFGQTPESYAVLIGYLVAGAIEGHAFLAQRRARRAWKERKKGLPHDFWAHLLIMCVLVGFQCFTNIGYLLATWNAPTYAVIIRGISVPLLFLLTGILIPLAVDATDILAHHNQRMLVKTANLTAHQHDKRIDALAKTGTNVAPVLAALWRYHGDEHQAGLVEAIDNALTKVEQPDTPSAGMATSHPTSGIWQDTADTLSEPAAKRQIRHLLEEDATLSVKQLQDRTGLSVDRCSVYRRQILAEWNMRVDRVAVPA